jgi:ribosome-binding factor A
MLQHKRSDRLSELMQVELSDIIHRHVKDPRVSEFCTVMKVELSEDLRHAKVYVSIMGDESQQKKTLIGLKNATGFIRREIGQRIGLRHTPELVFVLDKSIDYSFEIEQLIKDFNKENDKLDQN